jgi:hypothetical protein
MFIESHNVRYSARANYRRKGRFLRYLTTVIALSNPSHQLFAVITPGEAS